MAFIGNTNTTQAFTPAVQYFSGNGSTTAFTLSRPVASVAQVQAVVNNVAQNPSDAFTVSGSTITFTSAPSSGTNNIYVYYTSPITQVIAPGQGTVNTTALGNITNIASGNSSLTLQTGSSPTTAVTIDASQKVTFANPIQGGSITSGTAVASTSGTSIDFTSLPTWVKRITVMFNAVSTNGTSSIQVQIGSGSVLTSGYNASPGIINNSSFTSVSNITSGFAIVPTGVNTSSYIYYGQMILATMGSNIWQVFGNFAYPPALNVMFVAGGVTLSGTLDRLRLTTVNGTDTFDAGSINIMYEG